MNSVRFCTDEMLERFKQLILIKDYLAIKEKEISDYNTKIGDTGPDNINGRRQTNLGVFRAYLQEYLRKHPDINIEMLLMVRQLPPDETGIALEIYAFSKSKEWEDYEKLIADIFDHVLSSIVFFELRVFQNPSSVDFLLKNA